MLVARLCDRGFVQRLEQMLGKTLPDGFTLPASTWRNGSLLMGAFYIVLGAANIWVALTRSEAEWVTFKVFGVLPLTFVFALLQMGLISRTTIPDDGKGE